MLKLIHSRRVPLSTVQPQRPIDELAAVAASTRQGDPHATRTLVHAVGPHILRTIRAVLGRDHPALDDVAQEAVVEFLGALEGFREESSVIHFACRIAVLCALHHRRMESAQKRVLPLGVHDAGCDALDGSKSNEPDPENWMLTNRSSRAVLELLGTLPQAQADAFALHAVLGYTAAEIAESLAVPIETVRSRLRLARQALRRRIQSYPVLREAMEKP